MALTLADLFASPDHFLHSFEGDAARFVPMDRAAYHRSIFLDRRIAPVSEQSLRLPVAALRDVPSSPPTIGWIFHVAHCGSTLLARALDDMSANLVLREPLALRQIAVAGDRAALPLVSAMLAKRYRTDLPTIVKANVPVNALLPDLAARDPAAPAVFLHTSLPDYLFAILRSDDHRAWLRTVTGLMAHWLGDLSALPDAERAAALWLAQMRAFAAAIGRMPNARSLDAETLFAAPRETLDHAARLLGIPLGSAALDAIVAGPLFATYSKNPSQPFDNAARLARRAALERPLAAEIAQASAWVNGRGDEAVAIIAAARLGD